MPRLTTAAFRPTSDMMPRPAGSLAPLSDRSLHDLVRILHRLAALDLVDVLHPCDHLAPDGVILVEKTRIVETDEELAVRAVRRLRACHRGRAAHVRLGIELGRQVRVARSA